VAAFFSYIKIIIEMWAYLKPILDLLKKTPAQERQRVANALLKASELADTGDTSGYEDEINRGRKLE